MNKIQMVSIRRHNHDGRWYLAGQSFEANSTTEADEMECLGIAKRAKRKTDAEDAAEAAAKKEVITRDVKAEEPTAKPAAKSSTLSLPKKGEYDRRDMRAR